MPIINLKDAQDVMLQAHDLIYKFRNDPDSIVSNARDVDPVLHDLRVMIDMIEVYLRVGE